MTETATPTSSDRAPTESAIPKAISIHKGSQTSAYRGQGDHQRGSNQKAHVVQPKYRLHAEDLRHPESTTFFNYVPDLTATLDTALENIIKYLYTPPKSPSPEETAALPRRKHPHFVPSIPPTRSVTVFLRDFSGVAYTTGTELDNDHKEIHLSLPYISHCKNGAAKADPVHELAGVLTHELVHCYQHTSPPDSVKKGKHVPGPPGGLIEGIADFRGAWIEEEWAGEGAIGMLNDRLLRVGYVGEEEGQNCGRGESFWEGLFGASVTDLWGKYGKWLDDGQTANCSEKEKDG
ncbi:hypothetical protein POX_c03817 [Penicillium oxalicum]|uniref:hypothetical protein n=1 Tax=Penicillium oxalicum TaxID=69781 RepID=UPI0020B724E8|nr:hypothetical protein POX_c03817 [Penicillium oxalicum]KAI2790964.1 hypothetical protein POX_c03817 [Penicillium oxalicum]